MKALLCTRYGTPDDLEIADIAEPAPGSGRSGGARRGGGAELLRHADHRRQVPAQAGVAVLARRRIRRRRSRASAPASADLRPATGCIGNIGWGAAREKIAVAADKLVAIPAGLDFDRAAGLCVTYGTTLYALKDRAKLKAGETLAVLGASGGIGLAAVEIGKLMGARVIACASSDDKLAFARQHGADDGVNYAASDLKEALRELTGGKGVDVVYDPVGGAYGEAALRAMAWGGRYPGRRLRRRRYSETAAQSGAAEKLRRARRLSGAPGPSAIRRPPRQH